MLKNIRLHTLRNFNKFKLLLQNLVCASESGKSKNFRILGRRESEGKKGVTVEKEREEELHCGHSLVTLHHGGKSGCLVSGNYGVRCICMRTVSSQQNKVRISTGKKKVE